MTRTTMKTTMTTWRKFHDRAKSIFYSILIHGLIDICIPRCIIYFNLFLPRSYNAIDTYDPSQLS